MFIFVTPLPDCLILSYTFLPHISVLRRVLSIQWLILYIFFLAFDFCLVCVIIHCFHPRHNGQWPPISIPDFNNYFVVLSLFFRKSQYFPFWCWVLNKGTTVTIFITSLVWRGPWLGIEPGTSRTRSQHSTTRLSRRLYRGPLLCVTRWTCIIGRVDINVRA